MAAEWLTLEQAARRSQRSIAYIRASIQRGPLSAKNCWRVERIYREPPTQELIEIEDEPESDTWHEAIVLHGHIVFEQLLVRADCL